MQVLNIFHVLIAIALVAFVLIQRGQGATAGAAFGSGASGTVFGARGAGNFLSRATWVLAGLFCAISLTMAVMVSRLDRSPDNNLGVVGTTQEPSAVEETVPVPQVSVSPEEPVATDVPAFDPVADDLPALDSEAVDETGGESAEEGQESTGSGSDG